ncbi:MAG: hypothetical protein EP298_08725 [Gammaproteobacteria bacterium]|nr:MAG: hypothetical protein EP298_08725 [Gammaproteobacteria bacterium]UTW43120.1 hypothetical protein KFE69_02960 [bacterium SCSIO 12844]
MNQETELQFESPEKEAMLILANVGIAVDMNIKAMLSSSVSPVQLALSIKQLFDAKQLSNIDNLVDYQRWLEVDGSLFLELVQLNKHKILATLDVDLIGDNVRDYAIFRSISAIIKSGLEAEINKYHQAINHPRFDYVNFANAVEALSRR